MHFGPMFGGRSPRHRSRPDRLRWHHSHEKLGARNAERATEETESGQGFLFFSLALRVPSPYQDKGQRCEKPGHDRLLILLRSQVARSTNKTPGRFIRPGVLGLIQCKPETHVLVSSDGHHHLRLHRLRSHRGHRLLHHLRSHHHRLRHPSEDALHEDGPR